MSLVVEIIGPAGAGKSTLARVLGEASSSVKSKLPLPRRFTHSRFLLTQPGMWLPSWIDQRGRGRWFSWNETRAMAYTEAWLEGLKENGKGQGTVIVDHGPLFRLARIDAFRGTRMRSERFEAWWTHHLEAWLSALDLVVWLDAPDEVLVARVRERRRVPAPGRMAAAETREFFRRYRESFERIVGVRTSDDAPRVLRFDTSRSSREEITDRVAEEVRRGGGAAESSDLAAPGIGSAGED